MLKSPTVLGLTSALRRRQPWQICRRVRWRRDRSALLRRIAGGRHRHERERFDRGDRGQHRSFGRRGEFEPLLDDRDDGGADDLRDAALLASPPMERFLIAASDHPNGRFASRLAGLLAGSRGQPVTVLHVESRESNDRPQEDQGLKMASDVRRGANHAREARPDEAAETPDVAVKARADATFDHVLSDEAPNGYDFLMIGLDPAQMPEGGFNPEIAESARSFDGPLAVAIARGVHKSDPVSAPLKILAPVTGAADARHAAEVAIELARAARAELTILFLSSGTEDAKSRRLALASRHKRAALKEIAEIAERRDQTVRIRSSSSRNWRDAILGEAQRERVTLIVFGVSVHPSEALLFGEIANHLLEESPRSLLFVAS